MELEGGIVFLATKAATGTGLSSISPACCCRHRLAIYLGCPVKDRIAASRPCRRIPLISAHSRPGRCGAIAPLGTAVHRAVSQEAGVPGQCLVEDVRGVLSRRSRECPVEVVLDLVAVVGVNATVDDLTSSPAGG